MSGHVDFEIVYEKMADRANDKAAPISRQILTYCWTWRTRRQIRTKFNLSKTRTRRKVDSLKREGWVEIRLGPGRWHPEEIRVKTSG